MKQYLQIKKDNENIIMDNCDECNGKLSQTSFQVTINGKRNHKIGLYCINCGKTFIK